MAVSGTFKARNCSKLQRLPNFHTRLERLFVRDCPALTYFGTNTRVTLYAEISICPRFTAVPNWMIENEHPIRIRLDRTGLTAETVTYLNENPPSHVTFELILRDRRFQTRFRTFEEACESWNVNNSAQPLMLNEYNKRDVLTFLEKLTQTKEYGLEGTRAALADRVARMFDMLRDPSMIEEVLVRITDSLDACSDKPIWALNQLHATQIISQARGSRDALRDIGLRIMRLGIVHKHAKRVCESLACVDDVCVYLRFEIELREALDLPVNATAMTYPNFVRIEDSLYEDAKREALSFTQEDFHKWLAQWEEWVRQDRFEFANTLSYQKLDAEFCPDIGEMDMSGNLMHEPVVVNTFVMSFADFRRRWVPTGMDMYNQVIPKERVAEILKRATSKRERVK